MSKNSKVMLSLLAVLGIGLGLQLFHFRDIKEGERSAEVQPIGLAKTIPTTLSGWTGGDEPLGPTEFIQSAVERNLNYDDVVNRVFHKNGMTLGIYAAYWSPGRMPVQKVASHTPDRCWSENGWTCEEMRSGVKIPDGNQGLRPGYWRRFSTPGLRAGQQYVIYWHLVGGELYDYGTGHNRRPNPIDWWRDTIHYAIKGSAEQYFIRLTSDRPFTEIENDSGFQKIVEALAELGLRPLTETKSG